VVGTQGRFVVARDNDLLSGDRRMQDILWIVVTVAFFTLSIAYVHFCERVK
jgi:hypothetical protein